MSLEECLGARQDGVMKFELWVLTAAMGCAVVAGFFGQPQPFYWYEPHYGMTPEQIVADIQRRPIDARSDVSRADWTNLVSDYATAMGEAMVLEQVNAHPERAGFVRRLMDQLDGFCWDYLEAEHGRVGGNGHMVEHGDSVYVQFLMRSIVEQLPEQPVVRSYPRVVLPRLRSFEWRLHGLNFDDNGPKFDHHGLDPEFEEECRLRRLSSYLARRTLMMERWDDLADTLGELPTPVVNRIIAYLEWRVDQSLGTYFKDDFTRVDLPESPK